MAHEFKSSLPRKETLLSTTGSTNRFVACLFEIFNECMTITMNRNDDSYYSSDGKTLPLVNIPKEKMATSRIEVRKGPWKTQDFS